jgi:hypothetical protein
MKDDHDEESERRGRSTDTWTCKLQTIADGLSENVAIRLGGSAAYAPSVQQQQQQNHDGRHGSARALPRAVTLGHLWVTIMG